MSSIKDKLTQSVRQARSSQPAQTATAAPARKTAAKPAAVVKTAVKSAPAPKPAPRAASKAEAPKQAAEPASSATTLFPQRVWPD